MRLPDPRVWDITSNRYCAATAAAPFKEKSMARTVVVTGSTSGIGLAIATAFAAKG